MSNLETKKTYGLFASPTNKKLTSGLSEIGENVLIFPTIKTERNIVSEEIKALSQKFSNFDWLIFTDIFSVDYFVEILRELEFDLFELDFLKICALGEDVADKLRFEQLHADIIPTKIDGESVFNAISEFTTTPLKDLSFVVLKENTAIIPLVEKLKAAKSIVAETGVYKATIEVDSALLKLKTLLKGGAIDEFIFSSADDLVSLRFLFPQETPGSILQEIKVSATKENAFRTLLENGLQPIYFQNK